MIMRIFISVTLLLGICGDELTAKTPASPKPLTVLISIDGFKPDYLKRGITPNLSRLADAGAVAKGMTPSFPSITFPNHLTLVTGVVPDKHGIVNNTMQDPARPNARFRLSDRAVLTDPKWWSEVKPIWVTAHRQKKITSTLFWPGSEVLIEGLQPDDWLPYQEIPSHDRVVKLLEWLDRPNATRADFATLYFSEVDILGHQTGVDSPQTNAAIQRVDQEIGLFIAGLENLHLRNVTNLVIVSDHGMANTSPDKVIPLSDLAPDLPSAAIIWTGAFGGIEIEPSKADATLALLKKAEHMACWRKSGIPPRFQFGTHRRVPEIFCLAELGWTIINKPGAPIIAGQHGYDPDARDMQSIFVASGPRIKKKKLGAFKNTEVYRLLCSLIGIKPEKTSSGSRLVSGILR